MAGEVVRLEQGKAERKTVYSNDPAATARKWEEQGGDWLHIVDLDGAFSGEPRNLEAIRSIVSSVGIPCELGGGMRTVENVRAALNAGVKRVVIGTRAVESLDFLKEVLAEFGADRIAVGIDARNGKVAVKGWTEAVSMEAEDLTEAVLDLGVRTIIYTDIATDGMLQGPNLKATSAMVTEFPKARIIASGGVSSLADIEALRSIPGLHGAIIGKALYDNRIDLNEARVTRDRCSN